MCLFHHCCEELKYSSVPMFLMQDRIAYGMHFVWSSAGWLSLDLSSSSRNLENGGETLYHARSERGFGCSTATPFSKNACFPSAVIERWYKRGCVEPRTEIVIVPAVCRLRHRRCDLVALVVVCGLPSSPALVSLGKPKLGANPRTSWLNGHDRTTLYSQ